MMSLVRRLVDWGLHSEGSTRPLALIRIGLALLIWVRLDNWVVLYSGPSRRMALFCAVFFGALLPMLVGWYSRLSTLAVGGVLFIVYFYPEIIRGDLHWVHHHTYLLLAATLLTALGPCGRSYSVDRWLAIRRARAAGVEVPPERDNLWAQRLLKLQVAAMYFWTAFDKTNWGFLSGDRLQHHTMYFYLGSNFPEGLAFESLTAIAAVATVGLEYGLAFGLFFERTRRWLLPAGIAFHFLIHITLPVQTFTPTVYVLYLAFLPPDRVHRAIERLQS